MAKLSTPHRPVTVAISFLALSLMAGTCLVTARTALAADTTSPVPLLANGKPVDWWFVFKFSGKDFPGCGAAVVETRSCLYDNGIKPPTYKQGFGQQYVYASSADPKLAKGDGCAGETTTDPLGATYGNIFNGVYYYVVWNDQPKGHPTIAGCTAGGDCGSPWGHSKGMLAWNDAGQGVVLQVTTPSWPLSASKAASRQGESNTLGCIEEDDDVKLSQHFFALKLTKDDLVSVLKAMQNASIGTDPKQLQLVNSGGPEDVKALVSQLGKKSDNKSVTRAMLSGGVEIISKPSDLRVPPWQMVSALLGGVPLRTATFWDAPKIPTTTAATLIECWDPSLGPAGPVEIALTGQWNGKTIEVASGGNHAKIGASLDPANPFVIFGDENQQGALSGTCKSSQNGRGGMFFVLKDRVLADGVGALLKGDTAPTTASAPASQ